MQYMHFVNNFSTLNIFYIPYVDDEDERTTDKTALLSNSVLIHIELYV